MAWKKWRGTHEKGRYHAYWTQSDGTKRRKRSKALSRDEAVADRMLAEIQRDLDLGGVGIGQVVTVEHLGEKYLNQLKANNCAASYVERVRIVLAHVERLYKGLKLPALTADRLDDYKLGRLEAGIDAATVSREVGIIKTAVRTGRRWKMQIADLSDVKKPRGDEKVHRGYTMAQITAFLDKAPAIIGIVLRLGLYLGLRRYEILGLRWANIDWEQSAVIVGEGWRTKSRKTRALPIHPQLMAALLVWKSVLEAAGPLPEHVVPWKATPQALTGRIVYYLRKCGIPRGAIHSLRKTFATALKRTNMETGKAMRATGHATEKVFQDYAHLDVTDLREGVSRLNFEPTEKPKDALNAEFPGGK